MTDAIREMRTGMTLLALFDKRVFRRLQDSFKVKCHANTRRGGHCKRATYTGRCWQHPYKDGEMLPIRWRRYEPFMKSVAP